MADDEDEDAVYIVVELTGVIDSQVMDLANKQCSVLGIDTAEPVLKLGSYVFTGEYKDTIGTCVLFEEVDATPEAGDDAATTSEASGGARRKTRKDAKPLKQLKYFGKTEKRLDMRTSFLQVKAGVRAAESQETAASPTEERSEPPTPMEVDEGGTAAPCEGIESGAAAPCEDIESGTTAPLEDVEKGTAAPCEDIESGPAAPDEDIA